MRVIFEEDFKTPLLDWQFEEKGVTFTFQDGKLKASGSGEGWARVNVDVTNVDKIVSFVEAEDNLDLLPINEVRISVNRLKHSLWLTPEKKGELFCKVDTLQGSVQIEFYFNFSGYMTLQLTELKGIDVTHFFKDTERAENIAFIEGTLQVGWGDDFFVDRKDWLGRFKLYHDWVLAEKKFRGEPEFLGVGKDWFLVRGDARPFEFYVYSILDGKELRCFYLEEFATDVEQWGQIDIWEDIVFWLKTKTNYILVRINKDFEVTKVVLESAPNSLKVNKWVHLAYDEPSRYERRNLSLEIEEVLDFQINYRIYATSLDGRYVLLGFKKSDSVGFFWFDTLTKESFEQKRFFSSIEPHLNLWMTELGDRIIFSYGEGYEWAPYPPGYWSNLEILNPKTGKLLFEYISGYAELEGGSAFSEKYFLERRWFSSEKNYKATLLNLYPVEIVYKRWGFWGSNNVLSEDGTVLAQWWARIFRLVDTLDFLLWEKPLLSFWEVQEPDKAKYIARAPADKWLYFTRYYIQLRLKTGELIWNIKFEEPDEFCFLISPAVFPADSVLEYKKNFYSKLTLDERIRAYGPADLAAIDWIHVFKAPLKGEWLSKPYSTLIDYLFTESSIPVDSQIIALVETSDDNFETIKEKFEFVLRGGRESFLVPHSLSFSSWRLRIILFTQGLKSPKLTDFFITELKRRDLRCRLLISPILVTSVSYGDKIIEHLIPFKGDLTGSQLQNLGGKTVETIIQKTLYPNEKSKEEQLKEWENKLKKGEEFMYDDVMVRPEMIIVSDIEGEPLSYEMEIKGKSRRVKRR